MLRRLAALVVTALLVVSAASCKPEVGDSCKLSTDCSIQGDRLCDTSQPDGYCTIFNCDPDGCPSEAACVEFHHDSERFARRFCVRHCDKGSDCRSGYACTPMRVAADTITPALTRDTRDGLILDSNPPSRNVCLP